MHYIFSFTAGSLLINETQKIADLYLHQKNWGDVKASALRHNILQKKTTSSNLRQFNEVKERLSNISLDAIEEIAKLTPDEAKYLVYFSIIKTYLIIWEFILEVVYPRFMVFDYSFNHQIWDRFFEQKGEMHPEILMLSSSTKNKIRQVLFRILFEVGLINSKNNKKITPVKIPESIVKIIIKDNPIYLKAYLVSENEIKKYADRKS